MLIVYGIGGFSQIAKADILTPGGRKESILAILISFTTSLKEKFYFNSRTGQNWIHSFRLNDHKILKKLILKCVVFYSISTLTS